MTGRVNTPHILAASGGEVGDNSLLGKGENEQTQHQPQLERKTDFAGVDGDELIDVDKVIGRFLESSAQHFKETTRIDYAREFKRLARDPAFAALARRDMAGARAKAAVMRWLTGFEKISWRYKVSALKAVWRFGIGVPFPIDPRKDLPRLPRARRGTTPPDAVVKKWSSALAHESDLFLRLEVGLLLNLGWRPQHIRQVRWRHVQLDEDGHPYCVIADGLECAFKTQAPVAAYLHPALAKDLEDWSKVLTPTPESWLMPFRTCTGKVCPTRAQSRDSVRVHFERFRRKHGLPALRPKDLRHWTSSAARRADMDDAARAAMQGHDIDRGNMGSWYDNRPLVDLIEEQAKVAPDGLVARILGPSAHISDDVPDEAVALVEQYLAGGIGTIEFANKMEVVRHECSQSARKLEV